MLTLSSKKVPARSWPKKGRFGSFPQEKINSRPRAVQDGKFPEAFQRFPEASQKLPETCAEIFQRLPEASERPPGASQKLSRSFPIYPVSRLNALPPRDRRAASPSTQTLDWNRPPKPMRLAPSIKRQDCLFRRREQSKERSLRPPRRAKNTRCTCI